MEDAPGLNNDCPGSGEFRSLGIQCIYDINEVVDLRRFRQVRQNNVLHFKSHGLWWSHFAEPTTPQISTQSDHVSRLVCQATYLPGSHRACQTSRLLPPHRRLRISSKRAVDRREGYNIGRYVLGLTLDGDEMTTVDWSKPGYPVQHDEVVSQTWRYARNALLITVLPFIALLAGTVFGPIPAGVTAMAGAIALFGLCGSLGGLYDAYRHAQIHPYFQRPVGNIDTFCVGRSLARYFKQLDSIATGAGVKPLSAFGFNDDMRGETLQWHSPSEGLMTCRALLRNIETGHAPMTVKIALKADLTKWTDALERAQAESVLFCILLRHCNATSGHEWDVRQGSAF